MKKEQRRKTSVAAFMKTDRSVYGDDKEPSQNGGDDGNDIDGGERENNRDDGGDEDDNAEGAHLCSLDAEKSEEARDQHKHAHGGGNDTGKVQLKQTLDSGDGSHNTPNNV